MAKFNNINYKNIPSWHELLKDLMYQKEAWYKMIEELPERNMARSYQHKVIDICKNFAEDIDLAIEVMASKDQNNICFYLVDKDGDDDGTHFLCGNHIGTDKFDYTNHKFAADVAGSVYSYLTKNGYLTY